jgi:hypothetical protein
MHITYTVTITDLIQAIGVGLGFPTAVWGIFKLFIKDQDKARQLKALEDISISQNSAIGKMTEQITELSKQTAQFEYQSLLFKEGNELLKDQIKIQTDALLNDKDHKAAYLDLERKKRKSEIRPFFKSTTGGHSAGQDFSLAFVNFGRRAYFEGIEEIDVSKITIMPQCINERVIEKNDIYEFQAKANGSFHGHDVPFEVNLLFCDDDKNKYKQNIKGSGLRHNIETPIERE